MAEHKLFTPDIECPGYSRLSRNNYMEEVREKERQLKAREQAYADLGEFEMEQRAKTEKPDITAEYEQKLLEKQQAEMIERRDLARARGVLTSLMLSSAKSSIAVHRYGIDAPSLHALETMAFTNSYTESFKTVEFGGVSNVDVPQLVTSDEKTDLVVDYINQAACYPYGSATAPELVIAHDIAGLTGKDAERSSRIELALHQLQAPNYRVIIFCGQVATR